MVITVPVTVAQQTNLYSVKVTEEKKKSNAYIRLVAYTGEELRYALSLCESGNPWVVAIDYRGDTADTTDIVSECGVPILYHVDCTDVTCSTPQDIQSTVGIIESRLQNRGNCTRIVVHLAEDFHNMFVIYTLSRKYVYVRFCGGTLLRVPECNIGCLCTDDFIALSERTGGKIKPPTSVSEEKQAVVSQGCGCVMESKAYEDVIDAVTLLNAEDGKIAKKTRTVKPVGGEVAVKVTKTPRVAKPKPEKALSKKERVLQVLGAQKEGLDSF